MAKKEAKLQRLEEPTNKSPPWTELPVDITMNILQRVGAVEMLESAQKVCTTWRNMCRDPATWRVIHIKKIRSNLPYEAMCRHAVDRSQGRLTDLNLINFGTDDLLQYISERSSELRRLKLTGCCDISPEGLTEAVLYFPNIEELHLVFMPSVLAEDIESIGQSCPTLKSFTFKHTWHWHGREYDDGYAYAVAGYMPGLRHLRLSGNKITTDGLEAILDHCPELESLHLPECFNLHIEGDLSKRCTEQVKDFVPPIDYTDWDGITSDDESFSDLESSDHEYPADYDANASDDEMNDDNTSYKESTDDDTTEDETDDDDTTEDETDDDGTTDEETDDGDTTEGAS